jgi:uncharacterized alpha-E superfamily protein
MLSRVAERLYWMSRYLERVEDTARLLNVYTGLMLDLPKGVGLSWTQLIDISGGAEDFNKRYKRATQRNTLNFLLADDNYSGSIFLSLKMARENARTTRDLVPSEGWENVNELFLFYRKALRRKNLHNGLHELLAQLMQRCQLITGLLACAMSNGPPYQFVRAARNLERADMTTRIVDVGSAILLAEGSERERLENHLWTGILRTLSAHQVYRQNVKRRIERPRVIDFLLRDKLFPRSLAHSLGELQSCFEQLPRNDDVLRAVARVHRMLNEHKDVEGAELHEFLDRVQLELGLIHTQLNQAWFAPADHDQHPAASSA